MIRTIAKSLIYLTLLICHSTLASPIASVDRSVIAEDDSLTFKIRVTDGSNFSKPDLSPLEQDFHVLGTSQSSQHMIRNGQSESWVEWSTDLVPKRKGQLTIPPIDVNGEKTQAITINVQPSLPISESNLKPVFLESEVDANTVYVQQQLVYTVRIFQSIQLENMNISEPDFDNAAIEKLSQNTFQRRIKNTPYRVHELRYAIFPQQAGELVIPELVFTASEAVSRRSVFSLPGQGKPVRKMTEQHNIKVKPPLATFRGKEWLPAQSLELTADWSRDPKTVRVGDSITRTISTAAKGLLGSQLPPILFTDLDGAKLYPDQGSTETTATDNGVISSRTDSVAIIPTREGTLTLPAIELTWWNVTTQKMQTATVPATTLTILPSLEQSQAPFSTPTIDHGLQAPLNQPPSSSSTLWQWTTLIMALGWIITAAAWWLTGRSLPQRQSSGDISPIENLSEKKAFKQVEKLCHSNDVESLRQALIQWAACLWPQEPVHSLQDIRRLAQQTAQSAVQEKEAKNINMLLLQLDNKLYGNDSHADWNGENLLAVLKPFQQHRSQTNATTQPAEKLPPLYQT